MIRDDGLWTPNPTTHPLSADRIESETVTRHNEWTIEPDYGPDVDPPAYVLTCVSEDEAGRQCLADSGEVSSVTDYQEFIRLHLWGHPGHRSYRLLAELGMVARPAVEPL
ncbi:hypothetical protein [Kitasatospora sp. NPDC047058]|uniref:DUF7848 domain-containing protein n=1 Tax=Kitasatospora sp. NPDC047058 TaxID=3155620 RepID=UPI0034048858